MTTIRWGSAHYDGIGKDGKGTVSTESKVLDEQPYGFDTRFQDGDGTNPEELVGAAHAACYAMAMSFALDDAGCERGEVDVKAAVTLEKDGPGWKVSRSALTLEGRVPGLHPARFGEIAERVKDECPISKLLDCEITLEHTFDPS